MDQACGQYETMIESQRGTIQALSAKVNEMLPSATQAMREQAEVDKDNDDDANGVSLLSDGCVSPRVPEAGGPYSSLTQKCSTSNRPMKKSRRKRMVS